MLQVTKAGYGRQPMAPACARSTPTVFCYRCKDYGSITIQLRASIRSAIEMETKQDEKQLVEQVRNVPCRVE